MIVVGRARTRKAKVLGSDVSATETCGIGRIRQELIPGPGVGLGPGEMSLRLVLLGLFDLYKQGNGESEK